MHMSFPNFSPFPFSFAYLHIPEASLQPGHCLWGEAWRIFNLAEFSIRLSLQSLLLQTSCVPSLRLFSQSCLSLKGHLERTADVSRKDLEAVLASSCFTQKSDGFFLVNSLLTALNYTEEAEEKGEAGVEKFVWKKKNMGTPHPFDLYFAQAFQSEAGSSWSRRGWARALGGLQRTPWHSHRRRGRSTLSASLLH